MIPSSPPFARSAHPLIGRAYHLPSTTSNSRSSIWLWALGASLERLSTATMSAGATSTSHMQVASSGYSSSFSNHSTHHPTAHDHDDHLIIRWRHPMLALLFLLFCAMTVFGNCLVVLAVFTKRYLRNPTGYLIVSLAVADLIVGLVVMPLNSLFEMSRHVWLLGMTTCDIWHALDILASTSSIWNLCVISLDRYMAGVDPIGYRDRVSKRRIIYCIFFIWMVSACISFPAIFWWRASSPHLYENMNLCLFTDDTYYVVFSSLISFYIPLVLILFAYGRVYCIATAHSKSMKSGEKRILLKRRDLNSAKSAKSSNSPNNGTSNYSPRNYSAGSETLRIHFGQKRSVVARQEECIVGDDTVELRRKMFNGIAADVRKGSINSVSMHAITAANQMNNNNIQHMGARDTISALKNSRTASFSLMPEGKKLSTFENPSTLLLNHNNTVQRKKSTNPSLIPLTNASNTPKMSIVSWQTSNNDVGIGSTELRQHQQTAGELMQNGRDGGPPSVNSQRMGSSQRKKTGMREKSRQMIKQLNEQRAARTLSIVVGVFILCWTPFFLFTPLMVLCGTEQCFGDHETIFSIITWAGHLNSMLNPLIYSRFSRDFRKAFKQILTCERERPTRKAIKSPLNIMLAQLTSMAQITPPRMLDNSES